MDGDQTTSSESKSLISSPREFSDAEKAQMNRIARLARPDTYAEDRLGMKLHPKQKAVLRDLFNKKGSRVIYRCSNEVGKTRVTATAAILFAVEILGCVVVSTAGVFRQVSEQLIPSLKRFSHLYNPNTWQFLDRGIKRYDDQNKTWIDAYTGFSASDENYFQGYHKDEGRPLLIIIDESQGVADEIFQAAEDRCNPTYFMAMGSPGDPQGRFYEMETNLAKHYTHHKLTRPECLVQGGWWIEPADIERMIAKYGRDNPFVQSTVFGEFSSIVADAIISLTEYDNCLNNPPTFIPGDIHAACDFAAGRDKNVFAFRYGNKVDIVKKWVQRDTMAAVGEFLGMFIEKKKSHHLTPDKVSGDADGLGLPMVQRMRELDWPINEFHGGGEERFGEGYRNKIAEAWGEGIKKIKAGQVILPNDPDMKAQILGRKAKPNSSGQLEIERKEDYKKRVGDSPDEADAFFIALMPAPQVKPTMFDQRPSWQQADESSVAEAQRFATGHRF